MNGSLSSFVSITTILWNFGEFQKSGFDACCYKTGGQSQVSGNPQVPAQMKTCSNMQELVKIIQDMKAPTMSIVLRKKRFNLSGHTLFDVSFSFKLQPAGKDDKKLSPVRLADGSGEIL